MEQELARNFEDGRLPWMDGYFLALDCASAVSDKQSSLVCLLPESPHTSLV